MRSPDSEVVNHWPIAPGEGASGMAIDLAQHRLFLGCGNRMMVMMDSTSGKVVGVTKGGSLNRRLMAGITASD